MENNLFCFISTKTRLKRIFELWEWKFVIAIFIYREYATNSLMMQVFKIDV